jgi:Fe-S-cluster containining protein
MFGKDDGSNSPCGECVTKRCCYLPDGYVMGEVKESPAFAEFFEKYKGCIEIAKDLKKDIFNGFEIYEGRIIIRPDTSQKPIYPLFGPPQYPCRLLGESGCEIYQWRPNLCRKWSCVDKNGVPTFDIKKSKEEIQKDIDAKRVDDLL